MYDNAQDIKFQGGILKRAEEEAKYSRKEKLITVLLAFLLGVMFDYLFYGKYPGISHPIFTGLLIGFFTYCAREKIDYKNRIGWFVFGVIFLLSINFAIHSNGFLGALNFLGILFLIVSYTIIVTNEKADWSNVLFVVDMLERIFVLSFMNVFKPVIFIKDALANKNTGDKNKTRKNILIGLFISLPILIFIIPLLASADMVFNYYISNISSIFEFINIGDIFSHTILILIVFFYVFGYAWSFKFSDSERGVIKKDREGNVDSTIIITVLTVINIVYLLFTIIQFSYLYGGITNGLPSGFTHAEYARRGFFELVTVTIINFIIVLLSMKLLKKNSSAVKKAVNLLLSFLVAVTFNMLFSAHYKMSLYEESYGYTELRIYVHIFMLLMAILCIISLIRIWYEKMPLFKVSFISAVIIYIVLNYMNVQRIIASNNIDRYYKTGKIDASYLNSLSYDAVPEIIKLADDKNPEVAGEIKEGLRSKYEVLNRDYRWMEYNYSMDRAKNMIKEYFK